MREALALRGVREVDFAAEDLPVERREVVGRLWVQQAEELQLVDVEVTDGLHHGQLGHHLHGVGEGVRRGSENLVICLSSIHQTPSPQKNVTQISCCITAISCVKTIIIDIL